MVLSHKGPNSKRLAILIDEGYLGLRLQGYLDDRLSTAGLKADRHWEFEAEVLVGGPGSQELRLEDTEMNRYGGSGYIVSVAKIQGQEVAFITQNDSQHQKGIHKKNAGRRVISDTSKRNDWVLKRKRDRENAINAEKSPMSVAWSRGSGCRLSNCLR